MISFDRVIDVVNQTPFKVIDVLDLLGNRCREPYQLRANAMAILPNPKYHFFYSHDNGWREVRYANNPIEIEKMKMNAGNFRIKKQVPMNFARKNQKVIWNISVKK